MERGAPRRDAAPWHPIRLVRVDVDTRVVEGDELGVPGDRVWAEAVRAGQIVGLVETRLDGARPTERLLDDVMSAVGSDVGGADERHVPDEELAFASVVVPTLLRRPDQLAATICSLDALDYPAFEIILVDNRPGPAPSLSSVLPDHPRVRVVREPVAGISSARNRGVADSSGEFVAFTDDDAVVDVGWLRALGDRFAREPEIDAIGGLVLPSELDTEPQLWFEEYYGGFSQSFQRATVSLARAPGDALFPYAPGRFGAGCNMAFRRATLEALGGFDPTLGTGTPARGGEDLAIFIRLITHGGTMGFEPSAVVRHSHRRSEAEFLTQVRTYGTGLAAMYTSLVVRDPKTVIELVRRVPAGLRLLAQPGSGRAPSDVPSYPRRTIAWQLVGMSLGPLAYAHSWSRARRVQRGQE
jgi:cellulose synthase/poly-beta-1,6-N-acetylglucosamine synthase-like glycosyltransferase